MPMRGADGVMNTPESLSFKGCRTRTEALERAGAWFDRYYRDQAVSVMASRWLADDSPPCDPAAFQSELVQLRAAFAISRSEMSGRLDAGI